MQQGFSVVELLTVTAIIGILVAVLVINYRTTSQSTDLDTTTQRLVGTLDRARNRTLGSKDDTTFGVHLEADQYVEFEGPTYNSADPDNLIHTLESDFEIANIALTGSGSDVVFDRLTGRTSNSGTFDVHLTATPTTLKTVRVFPLGQADVVGSVSPTGTRTTDSRHIHFALNSGIKNALTLLLILDEAPHVPVVQLITMPDYMNADKTKFDWEDTISVNGSDQTLHIHTHAMTDTTTVLSVHRDRRLNDKSVRIFIDAKEIVDYEANGDYTVGLFGGTATEQ